MADGEDGSVTIHCLGGALVDILVHPVRTYPRPKEETSIFVDSMSFSPGGGAANSAVTLAQMGCRVRLFSKIGDDLHGAFLVERLREVGVDINALTTTRERHTSTVIVGVHADGDRSFISYHGALGLFSMEDIDRDYLLDTSYLLYPDYFNLPHIDGRVARDLLRDAQGKGVTTLVDLTWGISGLQKEMLEVVLPYVDYLLPSADELRMIYPQFTDEQITAHLLKMGVKTVVMKLGRDGALAATKQGSFYVPAVENSGAVVDTTGAGDNFNAGFVYGLSQGKSLEEAVKIGSAVASASILSMGASPDQDSVLAVLQQYRDAR